MKFTVYEMVYTLCGFTSRYFFMWLISVSENFSLGPGITKTLAWWWNCAYIFGLECAYINIFSCFIFYLHHLWKGLWSYARVALITQHLGKGHIWVLFMLIMILRIIAFIFMPFCDVPNHLPIGLQFPVQASQAFCQLVNLWKHINIRIPSI